MVVAALILTAHAVITWRSLRQGDGLRLLRVTDGQELALRDALGELSAARLLFLGEFHDQPSHHQAQLAVIRALHEVDHPLAIGLEMFRAEDQETLDQWVAGTLSLEHFLPLYYANWNFPWALYRDIFLYAREHRIPLVGLNVPLGLVQQVARAGFRSLAPEQLERLPMVRCVVDEQYEEFIRRAMGMHSTGGREFTHFCEAQLMWDTVMAINLLDYLEQHPTTTVAVLAGQGHAWKGGIPSQVRQRVEVPMQVVVPMLPARLQQVEVLPGDADFLWLGLELQGR
jgi:uncharacterized iron-regulated protein